jgi:transcriptional regulator with XRE-family HTH domain
MDVNKRSAGQPTKYNDKFTPQLAKWICRDKNFTKDEDLAKALSISISTLKNWKKDHPEFLAAIKEGKNEIDRKVEDALLKICLGYDYEREEIEVHTSDRGEYQKKKTVTMHVSPDPTSIIFWLCNRKKDLWRRNATIELDFDKGKAEINELFERMKKEGKKIAPTTT